MEGGICRKPGLPLPPFLIRGDTGQAFPPLSASFSSSGQVGRMPSLVAPLLGELKAISNNNSPCLWDKNHAPVSTCLVLALAILCVFSARKYPNCPAVQKDELQFKEIKDFPLPLPQSHCEYLYQLVLTMNSHFYSSA